MMMATILTTLALVAAPALSLAIVVRAIRKPDDGFLEDEDQWGAQ